MTEIVKVENRSGAAEVPGKVTEVTEASLGTCEVTDSLNSHGSVLSPCCDVINCMSGFIDKEGKGFPLYCLIYTFCELF